MASLEAALIAALVATPGVTTLVGSRVFVKGGRQGTTYPYITVQRITTSGAGHLDGASNLDWPLMQIESWDPVATTASNVSDAVRTAIDSNELTAAGLTFSATFQDQQGPFADEETRNFRVLQDYLVFHER